MAKIRNLLVLGMGLLLSGCKLAILDPKGLVAANEKQLLVHATLLMLIVVVPVIILSLVIAWRYRAENTKAKYTPEWAHSNVVEFFMWAIPAIIISILAVMTWVSSHQLDPYKPLDMKGKIITIEAIALDWKWLFIYPDQHIASLNYMQIPVNTQIKLLVTSDAPMNSLEIPQLAGQIYAMTGMQTKLHLVANEQGSYKGLSTNYSGAGFSSMDFIVKATSKRAYNKWVRKTQAAPKSLSLTEYKKLALPSEHVKPMFFSSVRPKLFNNVIMKYMKPEMHGMNPNKPG